MGAVQILSLPAAVSGEIWSSQCCGRARHAMLHEVCDFCSAIGTVRLSSSRYISRGLGGPQALLVLRVATCQSQVLHGADVVQASEDGPVFLSVDPSASN